MIYAPRMIERTTNDGITTLRLAHGKASALDLELVDALARAIAELSVSDARAVILTGTGSIFSAGVDLFRLIEEGPEYAERFVAALTPMFLDLFTLGKPVVAAVNGHAIAGGGILAMLADRRLMAAGGGRIGIPELVVGVPFPPAALEMLRFAVPIPVLQSLVYSGRTVTAEEALAAGIIDETVEPESLTTRAEEAARHLASLPPAAFRLTKRQLRDIAADRARSFSSKYDDEMLAIWKSAEAHARIREYLAKTVRKKTNAS